MPLYREKNPFDLIVFLHAVHHAVVFFHLPQISAKHSTDVDQRVHQGIGYTTSGRTTGNLRHRKLGQLCIFIIFREHPLDVVLECQIEGRGGNVTDAIRNVSTPERGSAKFGNVATETVPHAVVRLHFTRDDARV